MNESGVFREKMVAGRERMKQRCIEVALKYTPSSVRNIHPRKNLTGRAWHNGMAVPRPFTRKSLYIFLHECAHIHLGHCELTEKGRRKSRKPRHVEEMEAEKWAHATMRLEGLAVPRSMTARAKSYVSWKIEQAEIRGAKRINAEARRWSAGSR